MEDRLFGRRYRLTEKIGTGGMADVYKAKDEVLGRTVAVKVLHSKYAQEDDFVQRFRQEAQAAANLSHPSIVNIYDHGREDDETYYIVMEFVRGTDLKSYLTRHGKASPKNAAEWAVQVCTALSVAHGYGVIHRDIKPHNMVLMHDDTVKVMDFGIARAGDSSMTQTGSVLGTAQYVSPEQAQGKQLGPGSDLYSLGVVLYELVTGKLPFEGDSPITIALKQVNEEPVAPRQIDPNVPPVLEAIILQAMKKDPQERYHAADEMKADLKRFLDGEGLPAAAPTGAASAAAMGATQVMDVVDATGDDTVAGTPREYTEPPRRRTGWIWAVAIVLALAGAGAALAWSLGLFDAQEYTVPSIVGLSSVEASASIRGAGLVVGDVEQVFDDDVDAGKVISQSPDAGSSVEASSAVDFVVSKGVQEIEVPDLTELAEADAIIAIREAGLELETIQREYSSEVDEGLVMRQVPEPLAMVRAGTSVTIIVSGGTQLVEVPAVVGLTSAEAQSRIQDAGFAVAVTEEFNDTVEEGKVISQRPGDGVSIEYGSTVNIVVSKGEDLVSVPDVIDLLEADALIEVQNAGLVADVQYVDSPFDGIVLEQWPIKDASVARGSTVTLTVGKTPPGP